MIVLLYEPQHIFQNTTGRFALCPAVMFFFVNLVINEGFLIIADVTQNATVIFISSVP
jgi:hypothetical protein